MSRDVLTELADCTSPRLDRRYRFAKSSVARGLERLVDAGCRVTSIHPMFGPDTRLLSGRHVVFVDVGVPRRRRGAGVVRSTMAEQMDMSFDEHDRLMAYVLGLSHALNLVFFTALAESGELVPRLQTMSSTTFDAQLKVASLVATRQPSSCTSRFRRLTIMGPPRSKPCGPPRNESSDSWRRATSRVSWTSWRPDAVIWKIAS